MNFLLDLLFASLNGVIVNLVTSVASIPVTLLTEWLLNLFRSGGTA